VNKESSEKCADSGTGVVVESVGSHCLLIARHSLRPRYRQPAMRMNPLSELTLRLAVFTMFRAMPMLQREQPLMRELNHIVSPIATIDI